MLTISMFYGILIRMFFNDIDKHHLPHIHAEYQGEWLYMRLTMLHCYLVACRPINTN